MNQEYWGVCISKAFSKLSLNSPNDLDQFHRKFKNELAGFEYKPLSRYQQWDDNRLKDSSARDATYAEIESYRGELQFFLQGINTMTFSSHIYQINRCFSLCTLFPDKIDEIVWIYEQVVKGSFLPTLEYMLTMSNLDSQLLI